MPELPDIVVYLEALEARILGQSLERVRIASPFLLRSFAPNLDEVRGKHVRVLRRLGKRIAIGLEGDLWLVLHLMIAGRLHWKSAGAKLHGKHQLAAFDFPCGTLLLTEAGAKRRAALYVLSAEAALAEHDRGGADVYQATPDEFAFALRRENHTVKRALTDPRIFSGIGNAYSDEILHRARLSPLAHTQRLSSDEIARLHTAAKKCLVEWTERLRAAADGRFPEGVTAFRAEMAVHGKYRQPCPVCGAPVQRIRYAENETNYCPGCQTDGKIFADRSLSRLLKDDWPNHLDELD
jgi:formamidopyrimidine-DNA glycosylase